MTYNYVVKYITFTNKHSSWDEDVLFCQVVAYGSLKKKKKKNRKLKTFRPESARGLSQEVRAYKRFQL